MRRRCALAVFASAWLTGPWAHAEPGLDVPHLIQTLSNDSDFRVRTQAALALGVSKSPQAIEPLCGALVDTNTTVRVAAAAALGRLHLGGSECLEDRLPAETNEVVRGALRKALEPVITADTKCYVSLGKATDKTGRSGDFIEKTIRKGMAGAAGGLEGVALAPRTETPAEAKRRLSSHPQLKAFFLSPRVSAPEYSGGALIVRIDVAIFTYPDKALFGNYSVKLTEPDVPKPNQDSENELFQMAAERSMEKFAKIALQVQ
jgi:HEAT repeats